MAITMPHVLLRHNPDSLLIFAIYYTVHATFKAVFFKHDCLLFALPYSK